MWKNKIFLAFILMIAFSYSLEWRVDTQSDFNNGTYNNTYYNIVSDGVELNLPNLSGTYYSQIFDTVFFPSTFYNISWWMYYGYELPDFKLEKEPYIIKYINMSSNELLMHFNEPAGSLLFNETAYGVYTASCSGATCPTAGVEGVFKSSVLFDGSQNYLYMPSYPEIEIKKNITVSVWIKVNGIGSESDYSVFFSKGRQSGTNPVTTLFMAYRTDNNKLWCFFGTVSGSTYSVYSAETIPYPTDWINVVCSYDGYNFRMYVNGTLSNMTPSPYGYDLEHAVADPSLHIGDFAASTVFPKRFNGYVDELAIFSSNLSDEDIQNIYRRGVVKLNISVRSCDDNLCLGDNFVELNDTSPQNLLGVIPVNRFFQFKFDFNTTDQFVSPVLTNVSFGYLTAINPPNILILNPQNGSNVYNEIVNLTFYTFDYEDTIYDCRVFVNNTLIYANQTINHTTTGVIYNASQYGTYNWFVECNDSYGLTNVSYVFYRAQSYYNPLGVNISIMSPKNNSLIPFKMYTLKFNVTQPSLGNYNLSCSISIVYDFDYTKKVKVMNEVFELNGTYQEFYIRIPSEYSFIDPLGQYIRDSPSQQQVSLFCGIDELQLSGETTNFYYIKYPSNLSLLLLTLIVILTIINIFLVFYTDYSSITTLLVIILSAINVLTLAVDGVVDSWILGDIIYVIYIINIMLFIVALINLALERIRGLNEGL